MTQYYLNIIHLFPVYHTPLIVTLTLQNMKIDPPPAIVLTEWKAVQLLIHAKLVGLDRTHLAVSQNIAKT